MKFFTVVGETRDTLSNSKNPPTENVFKSPKYRFYKEIRVNKSNSGVKNLYWKLINSRS